jgi:hypothetical protein
MATVILAFDENGCTETEAPGVETVEQWKATAARQAAEIERMGALIAGLNARIALLEGAPPNPANIHTWWPNTSRGS